MCTEVNMQWTTGDAALDHHLMLNNSLVQIGGPEKGRWVNGTGTNQSPSQNHLVAMQPELHHPSQPHLAQMGLELSSHSELQAASEDDVSANVGDACAGEVIFGKSSSGAHVQERSQFDILQRPDVAHGCEPSRHLQTRNTCHTAGNVSLGDVSSHVCEAHVDEQRKLDSRSSTACCQQVKNTGDKWHYIGGSTVEL